MAPCQWPPSVPKREPYACQGLRGCRPSAAAYAGSASGARANHTVRVTPCHAPCGFSDRTHCGRSYSETIQYRVFVSCGTSMTSMREKPAFTNISCATSTVKPSVPSPLPPGSERADDMQSKRLKPYIMAGAGWLERFSAMHLQRAQLNGIRRTHQ